MRKEKNALFMTVVFAAVLGGITGRTAGNTEDGTWSTDIDRG